MTLFGLKDDEPEIFQNRDVLKDRFIPDEVVGREDEKKELNAALRPVTRDTGSPDNVFISGTSGVGKTVLTKNAMGQIADHPDLDVSVVWLNCQPISGETSLMLEIANSFRETGNKLATRGYDGNQARSAMFDGLEQAGSDTVLIVLDELDTVELDDQLLYHLPRAHEYGLETEVGLISISNEPDFTRDLPADVQATLTDVNIHFSEYDANQIREVLKQRAVLAFRDTEVDDSGNITSPVLDHGAVMVAAAKGAKHAGDARMARDILRMAGDIALERGDGTVTEDHIRDGAERYHRERMVSTVAGFSDTAKAVLYALITLSADGRDDPRTAEINTRYQGHIEDTGKKPVSRRQVSKYLQKFQRVGLTEKVDHGGSGGRFTTHRLLYEPDILLDPLADVVQSCGVHRSVAPMIDTEPGVAD